ncbi:hypothetical protein DICSQDRAFT_156213 [Dichomitus squalens LYAD-421 SS1]|uniref:C2H2-type domain-containing protein n=1 Tax=Dichomitus squalens (strain LYAD-421) TaxID=732165 RepID=R7SWZ0_DICSQ|nr:uncharacterized protein DICSQDRAFT_156213 [Dichomitus squalens LYAD-421 SS1]EJF59512.1 hypothetical protein DICSQDRAFT_156213 [Dichomitus squalens LYAD-421 SS1]
MSNANPFDLADLLETGLVIQDNPRGRGKIGTLFLCPFPGCEKANEEFSVKWNLKVHFKFVHLRAGTRYACSVLGCGGVCTLHSDLPKHVQHEHPSVGHPAEENVQPAAFMDTDAFERNNVRALHLVNPPMDLLVQDAPQSPRQAADAKPFVCHHADCNAALAHTRNLRLHCTLDFACSAPGCSRMYKRNHDLRRHMRRSHERARERLSDSLS